MALANRGDRCHGILTSGPNKGTRCNCNARAFSQFCGRHQPTSSKTTKRKINITIPHPTTPPPPDENLIQTLLDENKRLQEIINTENMHKTCLIRENDFLRDDVAGWMNEAEAIQDRANYFFASSNQWTKIALQMNMLLQDIKRQSSADHIKMLCDQVEYMELPQELTLELYHLHDVGFNPYTDVTEEDNIEDEFEIEIEDDE